MRRVSHEVATGSRPVANAMYAHCMSVRDVRAHLEELHGLGVSPDLISRVTDVVLEEVRAWRSRALDAVCPVVIFDAMRVKIRDKDSQMDISGNPYRLTFDGIQGVDIL